MLKFVRHQRLRQSRRNTKSQYPWILFFLICISLYLPSSSREVYAAEIIELFGVNLYCGECELKNERDCKVLEEFGAKEVSCASAFEMYLQRAVDSNTRIPAASELRRFLLDGQANERTSVAALQLLSQTPEGEKFISSDASLLAANVPEAVHALLKSRKASPRILDAFYKLPRQKSSEYIRGLVVAVDSRRHGNLLLRDLPGIDLKFDSDDLGEYQRAFAGENVEEAVRFARLRGTVESCRGSANSEFYAGCLEAKENPKTEAGKYLMRVQRRATNERMVKGNVPLETKISWLSILDVQFERSKELLSLFKKSLEELIRAPFEEQLPLYAASKLEFLRRISMFDNEVAALYSLFLVRFSANAWESGRREDSARALLGSYEIFPGELAARKSLVEKLSLLLPRQEPWFQELWDRLSPEAHAELNYSPGEGTKLVGILVRGMSLLLVTLCSFLLFHFWSPRRSIEPLRRAWPEKSRRARPDGTQRVWSEGSRRTWHGEIRGEGAPRSRTHAPIRSVAAAGGYSELRALLQYFELSPRADEASLVRAYRRKAKTVHPDTATGTAEEFARLTQHFQRAKALLAQHAEITEGKEERFAKKRGII